MKPVGAGSVSGLEERGISADLAGLRAGEVRGGGGVRETF